MTLDQIIATSQRNLRDHLSEGFDAWCDGNDWQAQMHLLGARRCLWLISVATNLQGNQ